MIQACTTEWGEAARILVVDDDDAVRRVTTRILARHGFEVFDAPSGESALEIFRSQNDR